MMISKNFIQISVIFCVTWLGLATAAKAEIACRVQTAGGVISVPMTSEDANHIYFFGRNGSDNFSATYHKAEKFMYAEMNIGRYNTAKISGNFLMTGSLPASLIYSQGRTLYDLICN